MCFYVYVDIWSEIPCVCVSVCTPINSISQIIMYLQLTAEIIISLYTYT